MAARVLSINKPHKQQSLGSLGNMLPSSSSLGSVPTTTAAHPAMSASFHSTSIIHHSQNSSSSSSNNNNNNNSTAQHTTAQPPQPHAIPSSTSLPSVTSAATTTAKRTEKKGKLKNLSKHKSNKNAESIRAAEALLKDLQKRLQDEKAKKHRLRVQVETIKKAEQIVLRKLQELREVVSNKNAIPSTIENSTLPVTISGLKTHSSSVQVMIAQLQEQLGFVDEICKQETTNARELLNELCKVLTEKIALENEVKVARRQLALKGFRLKKGTKTPKQNHSNNEEQQPTEEIVFSDEESRVVMKQVATEREKAKALVDSTRRQLLEEFFPEYLKLSQRAQMVSDEKVICRKR